MNLILGIGDAHLLGKILEKLTDLMVLTPAEEARLDGLWENVEAHLDRNVGPKWDEMEVQ